MLVGMTFPLTAYIEAALEMARYDKLEDGSFSGEIPKLKGVIAFGKSLRECENELRSTLEDWILVGLRLGHKLPVIAGINLNYDGRALGLHRLAQQREILATGRAAGLRYVANACA